MLQGSGQDFQQCDIFICFCNKFCCCRGEEGAASSGSRQDEMSHREEMSHSPRGARGVPQRREQKSKPAALLGHPEEEETQIGTKCTNGQENPPLSSHWCSEPFWAVKGLCRSKIFNSSDSAFLTHLSVFLSMAGRYLKLKNVRVSEKKAEYYNLTKVTMLSWCCFDSQEW